ncbi:bifunctional tRNA (5-methylaminomethyl-2-thiouridine)(34)-methyltransferase MnmD/FAD-dependent 5-carboxymethylaminomethyl-2-thiouridine(34) oxidoreductase MnmC [Thaumasiovibrio subtropicus]|uniref:bifunctional tRNA (5-methylaminomethyl-2-thiouridine)(34)-methyltransferase MnmD/FAD-dependent 5-carboxymethylaminomethyl-2-thiouridine(34) oxidoreductase MnmC n=1 Tax=Thaumasiovibrio subtropicus TaxID=1891207 RepID=UPI000B34B9F1|nr:bifunctional tRNA (5-methylaminomethyl-2-thiouridine)(34)-methyltransferase MnmD/FAD-dependent 5-carboxymethylaminomethyl-2-thiouridine(34) oxidoreductase MnmC [Thaumasiovibrio subtropicus]
MNTRIDHAQLDWNDNGTPVSNAFDDVYFSNHNGLEESRYVFITQNQLPQRWESGEQRRFVIGETGFGTGLNFLAVWQAFKQFRENHPEAKIKELHFISFEKFPVTLDDLVKAHQAWPELAELATQLQAHYPPAVADCHRIVLEDGLITLDLWFGDIQDCLPQVWTGKDGIVDCWFLDGFAPSKNEAMWSQTVFNQMARLGRKACTTATFTAAGFVRRGLIEAGFTMKKVKGFGTKREMLAGTLDSRTQAASHAPWYAIPPSTLDANSHVAIIGGGIASATTALSLARRGINVTIYCKDSQLANGASGNRQGAVYPLLNNQFNAISRFFSTAFIYARQLGEQVNAKIPYQHAWCGVTQLKYDDKAKSKLNKLLDGQFDPQLVHGLDIHQTEQVAGIKVGCESIHYPLGGWVCPQQLTHATMNLAASLSQQNGSSLITLKNVEIQDLEADDENWHLVGKEQRFVHSHVIVANGHAFTQFSQSETLPAYPVRGQVSHIPTNSQLRPLKSVLCYDGYLTPANNDQHCIGASYDRNETALEYSKSHQKDNQQRLINCLPDLEWPHSIDFSDDDARVGIRCATRDHLPFVGALGDKQKAIDDYQTLQKQQEAANDVAQFDNLYCLIGLGSRGLSSAPLLGELLASQMCGDPLPLPQSVLDALHPSRMWVRKLLKGKAVE